MPAQLDVDRHVGHVEAAEHEGVEQFPGQPLVVATRIIGQADRGHAARQVVRGGDAGVVEVPVGAVVPGGGRHPHAHRLPEHQVEFAQQVDAARHRAAVEIAVAVVIVGRFQQRRVLVLEAVAVVVLDGVVPADREIRIADLDLAGVRRAERAHGRGKRCQDGPCGLLLVHRVSPISRGDVCAPPVRFIAGRVGVRKS